MQTSKTRNRYKSSDKIPADHKTFIGSGTVEIGIDILVTLKFLYRLDDLWGDCASNSLSSGLSLIALPKKLAQECIEHETLGHGS